MEDNWQIVKIENWVVHLREPEGEGPYPVVLLVHGLTGDENSMLIFASRLPKEYLILAPRGLHTSSMGGYSWYPDGEEEDRPGVDDFRAAIRALSDLLTQENFPKTDFSRLSLMGFSQGAALVYTYALLHPNRVRSLAGLAGFLPEGASNLIENQPLNGKPVFVAHGTRDDTVPVERARQAVELLQQAGAQVTYCEDEVGHKLSASCFRALEKFFLSYSKT